MTTELLPVTITTLFSSQNRIKHDARSSLKPSGNKEINPLPLWRLPLLGAPKLGRRLSDRLGR